MSLMYARQCSLMIHNPSTSSLNGGDEVILNPEVFPDMKPGSLIQIFDPDSPSNVIVLKVPNKAQLPTGRMEISILKTIADAAGFKQFSRVVVGHISESEAKIDFVELSFRRQYLQRGNMLRFKSALVGRTVFQNQNITINSMQANIQDLRKSSKPIVSGLVTNATKFVFRSKSARIVWLVQISAEMWDVDKDGEIYFEKFLKDFVSPVFDSWKALGVTHMLTIIFFARTLYLDERLSPSTHPELFSRKSFVANDGYYQQDHIKIVLENIADIDKHAHMSKLRSEFWTFAKDCGWKIPDQSSTGNARTVPPSFENNEFMIKTEESRNRSSVDGPNPLNQVSCAVPSDSMHGNFLEAINISLNILSKHYMDRDLNRTGNSIVFISAGTGIFKVKPRLSLITKQRMLDNAFGIDCVSLARPPVHTVPLFVVNGTKHQSKDFYEVPHWIRISFTDCQKDFENAKFLQSFTTPEINDMLGSDWDSVWSKQVSPHPVSTYLSSQLGYYGFLVAQLKTDSSIKVGDALATLRQNYAQLLPYPLRNFLLLQQQQQQQQQQVQEDTSISLFIPATYDDSNNITSKATTPKASFASSSLISQQLLPAITDEKITPWGLLSIESSQIDIFRKTIILQQDVHSLRRMNTKSASSSGKVVPDIFDTIPNLKGVKEQHQASSYNSNDDGIISRGLNSMAQSLEDDHYLLQSSWHGGSAEAAEKGGIMKGKATSGNRHRTPSIHDNSSVGGNSTHSLAGLASMSATIGSESRHESVIVRKTQLQTLSRADEFDVDQMLEIFQTYDAVASNCFKRVTPQTVSLHDTLSGNSLSALGADENTPHRSSTGGRSQSSMIEVDDDNDASAKREKARSGSYSSPYAKSRKQVSPNPTTAKATASIPQKLTPASAVGPSSTISSNSSSSNTAVSSHAATGATSNKSMSIQGHAPMLGGSAAAAYSARLKPRQFTAPTAPRPPPAHSTASASTVAASTSASSALPPGPTTAITAPPHPPSLSSTAPSAADSGGSSSNNPQQKGPTKTMPKDPNLARLAQASMNKSKLVGRNMNMMMAAAGRGPVSMANAASSTTSGNSGSMSGGAPPLTSQTSKSSLATTAANAAGANVLSGQQTAGNMTTPMTPNGSKRPDSGVINGNLTALAPPGTGGSGKMVMRGGIMRMIAEQPVAVKNDRNDKEAEEFFEYQDKYAINPFRLKDGLYHISLMTHNRRRWSHVFPMGRAAKTVDYSLNWKSLTQPAILPLNTDYLPKKEELSATYTCEDACFDFDPQTCPFSTLSAAMLELICQRLSHEYQLIDNFDRSKYLHMSKYTVSSQKDSLAYILTMGHRIHVIVGDPVAKKIWITRYISKSGRNEEEKKEAETDRTRVQYRYEMWSTQSGKFQTLSQTFQLFPDEFLWSHIDSLILNETQYDGNTKGKKPRNLAYVIIPPSFMKTEAEVDEYFGRIDQLIEFLNKNVGEEPMTVTKERSLFPTSEAEADMHNYNASLWHRQASRDMGVMRRYLRGPKHDNPNWVYMKYDRNIYTFKAFHFNLEWFVCDSWEVNDFVNTLYRRSSKLGLRMCQTPGYYASHDLNIHPFRPIPYVQVPTTNVPIHPAHSSPMRVVERLFFSQTKGEWIFDSERNTDWIGIGLPFPNYAERDRDIVQGEAELNIVKASHVSQLQQLAQLSGGDSAVAANATVTGGATAGGKGTGISDLFNRFFRTHKEEDLANPAGENSSSGVSTMNTPPVTAASTLSQSIISSDSISSTITNTNNVVGAVMLPSSSTQMGHSYPRLMSKRFDRQYIHCHGLATVRVGGQGFLWLPSASAKVSDLNTPLEEKNAQARQKLGYLESTAAVIVECYEFLVVDLMERVFNTVDCREILSDIVSSSLNDNCPYLHHHLSLTSGEATSTTNNELSSSASSTNLVDEMRKN